MMIQTMKMISGVIHSDASDDPVAQRTSTSAGTGTAPIPTAKTDGDTLRWSDITAFGPDAVTVAGADRLSAAPAELTRLSGTDHRILGKRVLATTGDELGSVDDVEFDPHTGAITAVVLDSGRVEGVRLIAVGSYSVVVRAEKVRMPFEQPATWGCG